MTRIHDGGSERDMTDGEMAIYLASLPQPMGRTQWEAAAIRRAAKALRHNREAVESLLITRPAADKPALLAFRSEVIRISTLPALSNGQTLVNLSASTDAESAYALLDAAYRAAAVQFYAAIAQVDPSPAYSAGIKRDFDLVINQIKAAL